jgi:hypothetical protein
MANPFSGLENIGQSYLAGVQLANQRQAREEAMAQRQEEARVRERYYQDLVDQRREAARLAATGRNETLATKFGKYLKYKTDGSGEIDIVGSATAQEEAGNRNQFLETVGFAETQGIPIPGVELTPEERKSEFYNRGRAQGIVQKTKDTQQFDRILASQGVFPIGGQRQIPADLEPAITGQGPSTIFDILSGAAPAAPAPSVELPEGMVTGRLAGRDVMMRKPKTEKAAKTDYPGEIEIDTPEGPMKIKLTAEKIAERLAKASVPAGTTNAQVKARFQRDPITGKLVLAK